MNRGEGAKKTEWIMKMFYGIYVNHIKDEEEEKKTM